MIIGIAGLPQFAGNYIEAIRFAASADLSRCPQRCPKPEIEVSLSPKAARRWDALVLPGGGDIDPALLPGRPALDPNCHDIDPVLDRRQLSLLDIFVQKKKPVLGICKGMQLICLFFGGGLIQHLPTAEAHRYKEYDQFHTTHAVPGSFLSALYGDTFTVNSAHHQGICLPQTPCQSSVLSVIQTAHDGVPEGLIHRTLPILGLQWHPERLCGALACSDAADGSLIFQYFLSLCRENLSGAQST